MFIIIFVIAFLVLGIIFIYFVKNNYSYKKGYEKAQYSREIAEDEIRHSSEDIEKIIEQESQSPNFESSDKENSIIGAPANLALPFDVEDMGGGNEFLTPFGLIRHKRDKGHGHAGIDVPLSKGDNIYAVSDGTIIINEPATDGGEGGNREGNNIVLLITEGYRRGEGWAFLYEHISLNSGIDIGSKVSKKQLIGKSALSNGNNHLGLVYYFNDFKYVREPKCWVEHLDKEDKQKLLDVWGKIKTNSEFIESWRNAFEDGAYPYRALLNRNNFPSGPQLCYKYGLDVRGFV